MEQKSRQDTVLNGEVEGLLADRRGFIGQLSLGVGALAAGTLGASVPMGAVGSLAAGEVRGSARAPWSEEWLKKLTGKHKQFFDAVTTNDSFPLAFASNFLNLYHEAYGLEDKDLSAVVGLRHFAMPMALPDELWAKYHIGESLQINDRSTGGPASRNPFLYANGVALPGSDIPTLTKRGVQYTVCNVALTVLSGMFAAKAGVTKDAAKAEWTEKLLPGMTLVPVGVMAVNMAQEHGCTYCYAG